MNPGWIRTFCMEITLTLNKNPDHAYGRLACNEMNLLIVLTLVNSGLLILYFISRMAAGMTYTESLVARKVGAYVLTFLILLISSLALLEMFHVLNVAALVINIIFTVLLLRYFVMPFIHKLYSGRK